MTRTLDFDQLRLDRGAHDSPDDGLSLMEAAAFVAGEDHTNAPRCVSPILSDFGRTLNDCLDDDRRQELKQLIIQLPGTADDGLDEARGYLALDWLVRTYTPAWLELAGLSTEAAVLRALPRIADLVAARAAGPVVRAVASKAYSARAVARVATRAATCGAAWTAVRDAIGGAAWDAVWYGAPDGAGGAAGSAARSAAWDAVWIVAGAAGDGALRLTVEQLQVSAIDLFARMIWPDVKDV